MASEANSIAKERQESVRWVIFQHSFGIMTLEESDSLPSLHTQPSRGPVRSTEYTIVCTSRTPFIQSLHEAPSGYTAPVSRVYPCGLCMVRYMLKDSMVPHVVFRRTESGPDSKATTLGRYCQSTFPSRIAPLDQLDLSRQKPADMVSQLNSRRPIPNTDGHVNRTVTTVSGIAQRETYMLS